MSPDALSMIAVLALTSSERDLIEGEEVEQVPATVETDAGTQYVLPGCEELVSCE